jgi:Tfp pilus assembly protein PilF
VILIKPKFSEAYLKRGYAKFLIKNNEKALIDINKAISLDSKNPLAYKYRAELYLSQKENIKACDDLDLAKKYDIEQIYNDQINKMISTNCFH